MSETEEGDLPGGSNENTLNLSNSSDATASSGNNNSFLGKVKSSVSNMLPSSLSKWFSPSTKNNNQNDSLNGGNSGGIALKRTRSESNSATIQSNSSQELRNTTRSTRNNMNSSTVRRRIPLDLYDDEIGDEGGEEGQEDTSIVGDDDSNSDDEGGYDNSPLMQRRSIRNSGHPPSKRARMAYDTRDSMISPRQPLVASTPAIRANVTRGSPLGSSSSKKPMCRMTKEELLNAKRRNRVSEPAYNFFADTPAHRTASLDIIDLVPIPLDTTLPNNNSSRRSLNIPTMNSEQRAISSSAASYSGLANLKRQSLGTVKEEGTSMGIRPRRTSTTLFENDAIQSRSALNSIAEQESDERVTQNHMLNGSGHQFDNEDDDNNFGNEAEDDVVDERANINEHSPAANMHRGSRNDSRLDFYNLHSASHSRTSSFGNGLNFNSHLEGRKSLFANMQTNRPIFNNTFNNSTLSLTSLNRRQFNASIYGSTSALSDSRLINISSPFYKGKTMYGGASAYSKYANGTTPGSNGPAFRLTPTLIRPTSSLSTLSSSNNSVTHGVNNNNNNTMSSEAVPAISSTAKRILDLMNEFSTPLNDAKKMANSYRVQFKNTRRLTDADLESSRALRLQRIQKPYSRPSVTLKPKDNSVYNGLAPPTRELQVPSMSQLLQLKKLRSSTEHYRDVANSNNKQPTIPISAFRKENLCSSNSSTGMKPTSDVVTTNDVVGKKRENTLVTLQNGPQISQFNDSNSMTQSKTNHVNKMKTKVNSQSSRISKVLEDEMPESVNLPSITFPVMKDVPKFDIGLPVVVGSFNSASSVVDSIKKSTPTTTRDSLQVEAAACKTIAMVDGISKSIVNNAQHKFLTASVTEAKGKNKFIFSEPINVSRSENISPNMGQYKFSPPNLLNSDQKLENKQRELTVPKVPTLKTGSILDILSKSKPTELIPQSTNVNANAFTTSASMTQQQNSRNVSFGEQFKKHAGEWECDTCLIRNKAEATKCVACETPNKASAPVGKNNFSNLTSLDASKIPQNPINNSSFGDAFKPKAGNWECPTCMISNKSDALECVACQTKQPGAKSAASAPLSFSAFKPKSDNWECPTCLISNKNEAFECIACQTLKPGQTAKKPVSSDLKSSGFTFGFANSSNTTTTSTNKTTTNKPDTGFQSLVAAQKSSTWECEACMTRNDASLSKCVCCEQAKPGSNIVNENVPKFSFGSTAASKFTFGFAPAQQQQQETSAKSNESSAEKKPANSGFVFGSNAESKTSIPTTSSKGGFSFGFGNVQNPVSTKDSTDAAKSQVESQNQETKKTADSTVTTASAVSSMPTASLPSIITTTSTSMTAKPAFSLGNTENKFMFGIPKSNVGSSSSSSTTTTPKMPESTTQSVQLLATTTTTTTPKISFPAPQSSTTATVTSSSSGISFAMPSVSTTSSIIKPMFSFGSPSTTSNNNLTTTTTTTAPKTGAFSTGGFSFGAAKASVSSTDTLTSTSTSTLQSTANALSTNPIKTNTIGTLFGQATGSNAIQQPSFGKTPLFGSPSSILGTSTSVSSSSAPSSNSNPMGINSTPNLFGNIATTSAASTTSSSIAAPSFGFSSPSSTTNTMKNLFGSAGSINQSDKPTASATPIFGSNVSTSATKSIGNTGTNTPFVFGSGSSNMSTGSTEAAATGFLFGSSTVPSSNPPVQTQQQQLPASIFGTGLTSGAGNAPSTGFATSNVSSSSGAFGSSSTALNNNTNLFSGNNSAMGTFGSNPSANQAPPPSYGSTPTFGSFSAAAAPTVPNNTMLGGAAAGSSTTPFVFGSAQTQQSNSGGFNFSAGAATTKPAFNFTSSNPPAFNFTGTPAESVQAKPFQFGANINNNNNPINANPPVFAFGNAPSNETSASTPFQFNAGTAPVTNIFAPLPTATTATAAQMARRKTRQPVRRLTPR